MKKEFYKNYLVKKNLQTDEAAKKMMLTKFLKRKRLEANKTLEEVASGVCAVSYLSRIENNLVNVDDNYFRFLFEKLNINYDELREEKDKEIFIEICKCYLNREQEKASLLIENAMHSNCYVEIEFELMVLYDNIEKNLFKEAKLEMVPIEEKSETLTDEEMIFYFFLTALYAYKTNQYAFAFQQILVLCEADIFNVYYRLIILDLALDIFTELENSNLFFKYYSELLNNERYITSFSQNCLKHKAQATYLYYSLKKEQTKETLLALKTDLLPKYHYDIDMLIYKNDFRFISKKDIVKNLTEVLKDAKILALEALAIINISNRDIINEFYKIAEEYKFNDYEKEYEGLIYATKIIKYNLDLRVAYNTIKELLLSHTVLDNNNFFYRMEKTLLLELTSLTSKYKDTNKILIDLDRENNKIPYLL